MRGFQRATHFNLRQPAKDMMRHFEPRGLN
jgi:hypothetical protein